MPPILLPALVLLLFVLGALDLRLSVSSSSLARLCFWFLVTSVVGRPHVLILSLVPRVTNAVAPTGLQRFLLALIAEGGSPNIGADPCSDEFLALPLSI